MAVPGVARQPLKKLEPDEAQLLRLLQRWQDEAARSGCTIERVVVAYEAGRDGFWLARWLRAHGIEAHVIHSTSVAVSREHRRAKTDRLDTAIRQLQVKWDLFFVGQERKPPTELQTQVETLIRRHSNQEIRNNGERFRYQGLTARFTTFSELWQKRLRAREEGKVFGMHGLRAEQLPPPPPPRARASRRTRPTAPRRRA